MFSDKIYSITSNGVATIGGKDIIPKWIGAVSWSLTGYEGQLYTNKLNNVLYFTDSIVNMLSATALS